MSERTEMSFEELESACDDAAALGDLKALSELAAKLEGGRNEYVVKRAYGVACRLNGEVDRAMGFEFFAELMAESARLDLG